MVMLFAPGPVTEMLEGALSLCPKLEAAYLALFCAEASGDRKETPAARISRKRNTRVGKCETLAHVAESEQGGRDRGGEPGPDVHDGELEHCADDHGSRG